MAIQENKKTSAGFKDPIPAYAGMTRSDEVQKIRNYQHSIALESCVARRCAPVRILVVICAMPSYTRIHSRQINLRVLLLWFVGHVAGFY